MEAKMFEIPKTTNAGIYMLYNLTNHKAYIGKTRNFHNRALSHKHQLLGGIHPNNEMQADFNNGAEFAFAILEDVGEKRDDSLLFKEKQYIFAFCERSIELYNHETTEQLAYTLFYSMVIPSIEKIQIGIKEKLGCHIASLKRCTANTLKEKFFNSHKEKGEG